MEEKLIQRVIDRIFVELEASGRHVHLTEGQCQTLFGLGLTPKRPLSQPGQILAEERVTVVGPKGRFEQVAVLGPARKQAQVEISLTDSKVLGIASPVRLSGDVENTPGATIIGPLGEVAIASGVICARRHIHITPEKAKLLGIKDRQIVRLKTYTDRPGIFEVVAVRVSADFATYVHLDYDEANACGFQKGDLGRILV